jgi:hypothetical protein
MISFLINSPTKMWFFGKSVNKFPEQVSWTIDCCVDLITIDKETQLVVKLTFTVPGDSPVQGVCPNLEPFLWHQNW